MILSVYAGNAVKRATDNLVKAAQQAIKHVEERTQEVNKSIVEGMAKEIEARQKVLELDKQKQEAERYYKRLIESKYKHKHNESGASDTDGNLSGYESSTRYDYV